VTRDVGRHGLFVLTREPPVERHVVKLLAHTPLGPVAATAWVSRRIDVPAPLDARGAGLELFSLARAAKERWDAYVGQLTSREQSPALVRERVSRVASFVVRLTTVERLLDLGQSCIAAGHMFLVTPVLSPPGTKVALHFVHPLSDEEFVVVGSIRRVQPGRPKGIEIAVGGDLRALARQFEAFARTGDAPVKAAAMPPPQAPIVTTPASGVLLPPRAEASTSSDEGAAVALSDQTGDLGFVLDVEVDEDMLGEDQIFEWEDVAEERLIDLNIDDQVRDGFDEPTFDVHFSVVDGQPVTYEMPPHSAEELLARLDSPKQVQVSCESCRLESRFAIGRAEGLIGLFADDRPTYCPQCAVFVTGRRPNAARDRRERLLELAGGDLHALDLRVPLAVVLDVAALFGAAHCATCQGAISSTKTSRRLEREAKAMSKGDTRVLEKSCPRCKAGRLQIVVTR
jgi:hypothetical protein